MRILVAEDDAVTRMVLEATLSREGHEVVAAEDGRAAWDAFQKEYFPVVISDWMMPGLDGLKLCAYIRDTQRDHYSYIILLTALSGKTNYIEGMKAGADDFLNKPVDADQLQARIHVAERILGLRRHVAELEGLLPICAQCKKIRDTDGAWCEVETYVRQRSNAKFSHGLCPDCAIRMGW